MEYAGSVFQWKKRGGWYVKVVEDGKRRNLFLADTKTAAIDKLDKLKAIQARNLERESNDYPFLQLADDWFVWIQKRAAAGTVAESFVSTRKPHLERFLGHADVSGLYCSEVTPAVVRGFFSAMEFSPGYERTVAITIKQVMNWGLKQGLIANNPLARFETAAQQSRDFIVSPELHSRIMAAASRRSRLFIEALKLTGCRPGELRSVRRQHIAADWGSFALRQHKNARKTGKPRVVFLTDDAQQIFRESLGERSGPSEFVFAGSGGRQLTNNSIRCLFMRLRKKLELSEDEKLVAYSYRHTWATNALLKGIPIATVAELMGSSVRMIEKHYGHLAKQPEHLRDAMERANQRTA